jgi:hypothetical protein
MAIESLGDIADVSVGQGTVEAKAFNTENDFAAAIDRPGFVYDELADHAGGEAGVTHSGFHVGSLVEGLAAYYPLDDSSTGSTAVDATELGNDGTITGATYQGSGKVGSDALSFDGSDDKIEVSQNDTIEPTGEFTIALWVRVDESTNSNIVDKYVGANPDGYLFDVEVDTAGNLARWRVADGANAYSVSDSDPALDTWTHYAIVLRQSGDLVMFTDGTQVASTTGAAISHNTRDLHIGTDSFGGSNHLPGDIDDFRLYDRALSPVEVEALASRTETSPVPTEATL